jgi:hypothetical protein
MKERMQNANKHTFTASTFSSSSSGIGRSLLGTGVKSCAKLEKLLFSLGFVALALALRCSEARCAGDEAGSRGFALTLEGVAGDDFWKNPRMDFWLFMFWALEVVRFNAEEGVPVGEEASPLAIVVNWR